VVDRLLAVLWRWPPGHSPERRACPLSPVGAAASAALPVLAAGQAAPDPTHEIIALAAIGSTASDLPVGVLRPAFQRADAVAGVDRIELIRGYTRITADGGPVLAELPDAGSDAPLSEPAMHLVGALGPAGAGYADRLERLLPELGTWATLGAARSHWEITGAVRPAGQALAGLLADLGSGRPAGNADLLALRRLAEMGFVDPALTQVLRFLIRAEARVTGPAAGWHGIDLDEMIAATARRLLDAGEPGAGEG
jgi:hypothetical protein